MSRFSVRPRFSQILDLGVDEAQARILRGVEAGAVGCEVKKFPGFICLRVPEQERHFWSPRLNLGIEPTDDGKTRIEGIYGPNANVWSLFLYGYLITGSFTLFSGILGFVQWSLGNRAWGLWIFAVMSAAVIGLYLLGRFGRKVGEAQTLQLHHVYEAAMGRTVEIG